jgi:hypothetical protein
MRNIFWYDNDTHRIKVATHFRFDEGMNDLAVPTPNVKILQRYNDDLPVTLDAVAVDSLDLNIDPSPFRHLDTITVPIQCHHPSFGINVGECHIRRRAYISSIDTNSSVSMVRNFRSKYTGAFIVALNDIPVYDVDDATAAFLTLAADPNPTTFDITLAPEKYIPVRDRRDHMTLNIRHLRHLTELVNDIPPDPLVTDHHISCRLQQQPLAHATINTDLDVTTPSSIPPVPITPSEAACSTKLTRRKLNLLDTWPLWQASERLQLDKMHEQHMFAESIHPPLNAIILNPVWNYYIKDDGTRKARQCCDGSPRAAPYLHQIAVTYASCIEQPVS